MKKPNPQLVLANLRRHSRAIRVLHWLVAGLIIAALVMSALVMPGIPGDSPEKIDALRRHMSTGVVVLLLTVVRMLARRRQHRPAFLSSGMARVDRLAQTVHRVFDVLILAMIASGIGMALLGGLLPAVMGFHGTLPANLNALPLHSLHRAIGIALFLLLSLHVAGALYHQFILRDGLLGRMAFSLRRN